VNIHRCLIAALGLACASDFALAQSTTPKGGLEEIVVTAQRREQSLQDASIALDVLSGDRLLKSGITNARDLSDIVPALTVTEGGGINNQIYMRGVGNRANNDYLDPAIIVTYDGVALARGSGSAIGAFYDLERVEVLKGPQGTLYGKNATGGVLNVIPVPPRLGETSGYANASFGNYGEYTFQGALNLPAGERNAFRIAGNFVDHDGYNRDGTNDAERWSVRAQFLTEPTDDVRIRVAADYNDYGGAGNGTTPVGSYQPVGLADYVFIPSGLDDNEGSDTPAGNAYRQTILSAPGFGFLNPIQDKWFVDAQMYGVNAEVNWDTALGTWTIIPAWRETKQESLFNGPGFNSGWWNSEVKQTSLEVRLSGATDRLVNYVVGAYYFDEDMVGNNTFNQEFVLPLQDYKQTGDSWAVFGQITWKLTDAARFVTGVRYTDDHKEMNGLIDNYIVFCGGLGPKFVTPPASFAQGCAVPGNLPHFPTLDTTAQADAFLIDNGWAAAFIPIPPGVLIPLTNGVGEILHATTVNQSKYDKQKTTYRLALEWDAARDSMIYAGYETGYRSGGLQPSSTSTYDPEYVDAYTIGAKNRFLDGRMQLNVELFYWDYQDQQISYFTLTEAGVLENLTDNVGAATSQGVDLDFAWLATDGTVLTAKVQYLDATYDNLHFETGPPRDNINCPFTIIGVQDNGAPALDFDCSANQAVFSPEWTIQGGIEQTFPLGAYRLVASLNSTWVDDQQTGFNNLPHEFIESHSKTDFDLTLISPNDTWSIGAYVYNLEDDRIVQSTQTPLLGMAMSQFGPGMTYGMRLNYNF
jgi:iron complex outermembrane recepter protein